MKRIGFAVLWLSFIAVPRLAGAEVLSGKELEDAVAKVCEAQNRLLLATSSVEDLDKLFEMYASDFVYVHEAYGGTYSRDLLYGNSAKYIGTGHYKHTEPRYRILRGIPGHGAAAVERLEVKSGKIHLSVFEFKGDKVSRIVEYWK